MLQAKLSSKLYYLNIFPKIVKYLLTVKICVWTMFLSPTMLPLLQYPLHNMACCCQERAPILPRPTYLHKDEEEAGGLQDAREKISNNSGKKSLYSYTEKEEYDNTRCFCCFMPVIYFFWFQYVNSLKLKSDFYLRTVTILMEIAIIQNWLLSDINWIFCAWNFFLNPESCQNFITKLILRIVTMSKMWNFSHFLNLICCTYLYNL